MRQLKITKPHTGTSGEMREQAKRVEGLLSQWAALGSAGLSLEASALQPFIAENARFVASLTHQYQSQGVSQETLLTAAHGALISLLNQYMHRQDQLDKVLAPALRNAMASAIPAPAGEQQ